MKYELVAFRLKEALDDNNMTRAELSRRTGITEGSLSQYYSGIHCPNNATAKKIADVLGVSPVWLMGFDVDKYPIDRDRKAEQDARLLSYFHKLSESDRNLILQMAESLRNK